MQQEMQHQENNGKITILFAREADKKLASGEIDEAIYLCEDGIKKYPMYAQGHFVLGKCYQAKGMNTEAKAEFERVLRFDPGHISAIQQMTEMNKAAGYDDKYQTCLHRLFVLDPLNEPVISEIRDIGKYDEWGFSGKKENSHVENLNFSDHPSAMMEDIEDEQHQSFGESEESESKEPEHNYSDESITDLPGLPDESTEPAETVDESETEKQIDEADSQQEDMFDLGVEDNLPAPDSEVKEDESEALMEAGFSDDIDPQAANEELVDDADNEDSTESISELMTEQHQADISDEPASAVDNQSGMTPEEDRQSNPVDGKLDLNQYSNLDEDFTTIMHGIFKDGQDEDAEGDTTETNRNMQESAEIEKEMLAEERPVDETLFLDPADVEDENPSFAEMDYAEHKDILAEDDIDAGLFEDDTQFSESTHEDSPDDSLITDNVEEPGVPNTIVDDLISSRMDDFEDEPETFDQIEEKAAEPSVPAVEESVNDAVVDDIAGVANDHDVNDSIIPKDLEIPGESTESDITPDEDVETEQVRMDEIPAGKDSPFKQKIISQTLGEILVSQKKYHEARNVFLALKEKSPENRSLDKKIALLNKIITLAEKK